MITMAEGPFVDRTTTGVNETAVSTPASVAEEPTEEPATVDMFTSRIGAATSDSKDGRGRPPIFWGQVIL